MSRIFTNIQRIFKLILDGLLSNLDHIPYMNTITYSNRLKEDKLMSKYKLS